MLKTNRFLLFFIFYSSLAFAGQPDWINKPQSSCKANKICASGSGESLSLAKADASKNISKYFKTEIKSSFKSELSATNNKMHDLTYESIEDDTSGIYEGIEIVETYSDKEKFYAFASLDKNILANKIKFEIDQLDEQMKILLTEGTRKSSKILETNYFKREVLNGQYLFLMEKSIPEVITYDDVIKNKNKFKTKNLKYYVSISGQSNEIVHSVENLIVENGSKIVKNKEQADRIILGNITSEEQYINVAGFKKFKFLLKLDCYKDGVVKNTISTIAVETGRNESNCYNKAAGNFNNYLQSEINNLLD